MELNKDEVFQLWIRRQIKIKMTAMPAVSHWTELE
jgi:hypothetical protein